MVAVGVWLKDLHTTSKDCVDKKNVRFFVEWIVWLNPLYIKNSNQSSLPKASSFSNAWKIFVLLRIHFIHIFIPYSYKKNYDQFPSLIKLECTHVQWDRDGYLRNVGCDISMSN